MNAIRIFGAFLPCTLLILSSACSKDDPKPSNEEELITEVHLHFQKVDESQNPVGEELVFSWVDLDGELGSEPPVIDEIVLEPNSHYNLGLELIDGSSTVPKDITDEIIAEGDEHQFFFLKSEDVEEAINFTYSDHDEDQKPIGQLTRIETGSVAIGSLEIVLRHQPDKDASGVDQGEIENAGGETDVQVEFPLSIED
jgi:hypothetical protein